MTDRQTDKTYIRVVTVPGPLIKSVEFAANESTKALLFQCFTPYHNLTCPNADIHRYDSLDKCSIMAAILLMVSSIWNRQAIN